MDYTLSELLYTGADTRVVAGLHRDSQTPVVLKLPRHELPAEETLARLRDEYALLRELALPGIIRAVDLLPYGAGVALVLEHWGAGSLDRRLASGPLPVAVVLRLGAALARVIGQMHQKGVIHCDIKPQNILINAACSEVRLIDFGVARRRSQAGATPSQGELLGTLAYMAPEQTGRMRRSIDARADLYALGGTLYHLLTGELPFAMTDELSLIHAHIARRPIPPHERAEKLAIPHPIPQSISTIVMKLLEKSPEQRYQTADGAAFDMEHALSLLEKTGEIQSFALGTHDWEDRIRRPSRLFGREREQQALMEALRSVRHGAAKLVLVAGPSGVGKSALVGAVHQQVLAQGGSFAAGKFDLLQRGTPYAALGQAVRALVRRKLDGSAEELARWRQLWSAALGASAKILVDFSPELVQIIGEPQELLEIGPVEAKHRFLFTMKSFIRATAAAEQALVLFIDDLHWADGPSLSLLEELITDPELKHVLLIGAFRDSEVKDSHPLHTLSAAAAKSGRLGPRLTLAPLDDQALFWMVEDMLHGAGDEVKTLSALVKAKTDGSPFFAEQFLRALHDRKIIWRDLSTGGWCWDEERIARMGVSDNLVALLMEKIDRLSVALRRMLALGACIGASFEASLLSLVGGLGEQAYGQGLETLLQEGLLVRAGDGGSEEYAFVHDRVQQTAYELLTEPERQGLHLELARALARRRAQQPPQQQGGAELFTLLYHYLQSLALLSQGPAAERCAAAEYCLLGGKQAKLASAYTEAARLLSAGRALVAGLGEEAPTELGFELELALAEAVWLAGRPEAGEQLFAACRSKAERAIDRGRVAKSQAALLLVAGRYQEGLDIGLGALAELGWSFSREPAEAAAAFGAHLARLVPKLMEATPDSFCTLPICTDKAARVAAELFPVTILGATVAQPALAPSQMFALLESAFSHGLSPGSMFAVGAAALVFTSVLQDLELGARCVELAFACRTTPGVLVGKSLVSACLPAQFVHPDLGFIYKQWHEAGDICRREGDITHAETAESIAPAGQMGAGQRLSSCQIPAKPSMDLMAAEFAAAYGATHDLLAKTHVAGVRAAIRQIAALPTTSVVTKYCTVAAAAFAALHLLEDKEAWRLALEAAPLAMGAWSNPPTLWNLKVVTILGALLPAPEDESDKVGGAEFTTQRAWLARLGAFNPATFRHVLLLVEAGEARSAGQHEQAERLYEQAAEHARQQGFVHDEALALRLCGEYLLSRGRVRMARTYLRDAHDAYLRWEATNAAAVLRDRYREFFSELEPAPAGIPAELAVTRNKATVVGHIDKLIDTVSLFKAAQALSSDRDPDSLLGRMLRLLTENAGADRAVLLLLRKEKLFVRAELLVELGQFTLYPGEPPMDASRLPVSAVQYVARGHEPLVLFREGSEGRFENDPYFTHHRPASLLILPLLYQGRLLGVMVLEHSHLVGAFPEARVEVVTLLAGQAAAAVENAVMYTELASSHQRLERLVAERTAELKSAMVAADTASRAKSDFLANMSHELRTPLTGILGYAQILERASNLAADQRSAVGVIRASGEHLLMLINDVLDLAKIEAGKIELVPREMSFRALLRMVVGICQPRAAAKGLLFTLEEEGIMLGNVIADQKRLNQILLNLLGNALKFTERGQVVLRVKVEDAPRDGRRTVRFRVQDTGPGIAAEHLAQIFEPFEQVGSLTARTEGTGLGLSITKRLVELMGGAIQVESQLGQGSAFEVCLPFTEVSAAPASGPAESLWARVRGYEGARRTLLIVDDRAANRAVLRDMLSPLGFLVLEAPSGEEALKMALTHRPDAILMDLAMPGMDGYETTRRLRRMPELARVLIIACSASISAREGSMSAGFNDFLPKPLALEELLEKLQTQLGLLWQLAEPATRAAAETAPPAELVLPPTDSLTKLLELASKGRLSVLLKEIERLRQEDKALGPFLGRLQELSMAFRTDEIRNFLRESLSMAKK